MIEQRTTEWFLQRAGKVTASRLPDVLATIKSGEAASRANYRAQLIAERLTGSTADSFINAAMQWGTEQEPVARKAYEVHTGEIVTEVGFIDHPIILNAGASPDGFVGDKGLVELKCPNTGTHIDTLLSQKIPPKYVPQMQWQMACTNREWCDFVSFDPRMPEDLQLFIQRLHRDASLIAEYEYKVQQFLAEVDAKVSDLQQIRGSK